MSDYEVTLVNDNSSSQPIAQATYLFGALLTLYSVRLRIPPTECLLVSRAVAHKCVNAGKNSTSDLRGQKRVSDRSADPHRQTLMDNSTLLRRPLESPRRTPRPVSVQEP